MPNRRLVPSFAAALLAAFVVLTAGVAQAQQLSINDVSLSEGNAGTTTFTFTVSLSAPAGPGGVTFDIATADDTAAAPVDYTAKSLTSQIIPSGNSTYTFNVLVNGDTTPELNETFFVNVTNVTSATVLDGQGQGTVVNDDIIVTPIHDLQGIGAASPIAGSTVTIQGVVTGVTANGFFVQEEESDYDADPATSEAIFVFTSTPPPGPVVVTSTVRVIGTVAEAGDPADPQAPSATWLVSPIIANVGPAGQPLPAPIPLTTSFPHPAGPADQLERVEHMRVSVTSLTVSGPSAGVVNETDATAANDGRFYGVVTGVARPFREPGIQPPDVPPSGSIPPIPRFDGNPERIRVESATIAGQTPLLVSSGDLVGPLTGPLTYGSRAYALLPDGTSTPAITPGTLTTTVSSPAGNEATVASINLQRFFDTVDDPALAEPVLTALAYSLRLGKVSLAIRDHLHNPDIIGVQEAETLAILQDLAARIQTDGGPAYQAFLIPGSDTLGLAVGLLVKTEPVSGGLPRVSVTSVTQLGAAQTWTDPATNTPELLYDRPPLLLEAQVNRGTGATFQIAVIVTDFVRPAGIDSTAPDGLATIGQRVRAKRQAQATDLATSVQNRQTLDPADHLIVIGGFNALDVNDGYVDVMSVLAGTPVPDNQTVVPGDGVDLVTPNLERLVDAQPLARYSEVIAGNASATDHVLAGAALVADTTTRRIERAHLNADHPETQRNDGTVALRFSDRDPVVAYFATNALILTDVSITNAAAATAVPGGTLVYTITVGNNGPDTATMVSWSDTLPAGAVFESLSVQAGWSCTTPAVGAGGTISCSVASLGAGSVIFSLEVSLAPGVAAGTTLANTVTAGTATPESDSTNNAATATTIVDGAPTITAIGDQTTAEDTATMALSFTIGDVGTPAASLTVSAASSDQTLVPDANIIIGGSGATRSIVVTPAANGHGGPIVITLTVSDGAFSSSATFALTVTPVNDAPTVDAIADQTTAVGVALGPLALTIGDIDNDASDLVLSAASSNTALVKVTDVVFGGGGTGRTVTITPQAGQHGEATITITVSDGDKSASTLLHLTVSAATPLTYYLAEGATGDFFDEDLLIANPNAEEAPVTLTFYRENATSITETRTLPAKSGLTLHVDTLPGMEATAASVKVSSDSGLPLAVERTQFWGAGSYGGHTENAVTGPAARWYFAEGAQGYFDTFVLVANPQTMPANLTLTFLREGESAVTATMEVAPLSRKTIAASSIADLQGRAFSIVVDSTLPVVAERAMYFGTTATQPWSGGGAAAGVTAPSTAWLFAEGATGAFFDTFILLLNPDTEDAQVTMHYLLDGGETIDVPKVVPARGRLTVSIDGEDDPRLHSATMSTRVTSDRPIVAERSVYWPTAEGAEPWGESHTSQGATAAAPRWALAEGRTGGALNFHTYVLLANSGTQAADVTVQFLPESGAAVVKTYTVPAASRFTIDVTAEAPTLRDRSFITLIDTSDTTPIVVERSMYWDGEGLRWSGGSNAFGTRY